MKCSRADVAARLVAGRCVKALDMVGYVVRDPIELRRRGV
jgi:hypothetical protein